MKPVTVPGRMAPPVHRPSRLSSCLAFALLASAPITASQEEPSEPPSPSKEEAEPDKQSIMSWLDERLRWKFVDEELNLTLGGLLQIDGTAVAEDDELEQTFGDIGNSVRARRARLQANGLFYDVLFRAVYDFGQDSAPKDVFVQNRDRVLEHVTVRLGHMKEPFGLERQNSNKYRAFQEMSLPVTTFAPSRSLGAMLFHPVLGERATWAVGGFTSIADFEDRHESGTSDLTVTGRLTGLPLYENEGHRLVHLGGTIRIHHTYLRCGLILLLLDF